MLWLNTLLVFADKTFYMLRQLWQVSRSLDVDSAKRSVHVFVMSHVDYCNSLLAWGPIY